MKFPWEVKGGTMDAVEYYQNCIAHFGTKGQTWGLRRHQSYETAPTRSGMVGQEVGEASKQRSKKEEKAEAKAEKYRIKQYEQINRHYDIENAGLQKVIDKASERSKKYGEKAAHYLGPNHFNEKKGAKFIKKSAAEAAHVDKNKSLQKVNEILRKKELNYVKNMSIKDIKKEKRDMALSVIATAAANTAGVFIVAATGAPMYTITVPSYDNMKRKRRYDHMKKQEEAARRS